MLFMVPFVCLMIFIYSIGLHARRPALLPLLRLHLPVRHAACWGWSSPDNLLILFVFWEIMGLCSYLLIGFWFEKPSRA